MKINEKNLSNYATKPPFDLVGWLNKRSSNNSWQRRYFVLKNNLLFYFEKKGDKEPLGLIVVEDCTIELTEEFDGFSFEIVFNTNRTSYTLSADTQENMETWMKSLASASYEYKKAMVLELQRQLNDIHNQRGNDPPQNALCLPSQQLPLKEQMETLSVSPKPPPRRQNPFNRPAPPPPTGNVGNSMVGASTSGYKPISQSADATDMFLQQQQLPDSNGPTNFTNTLKYNWETFGEESSTSIRRNLNAQIGDGSNNSSSSGAIKKATHLDRKQEFEAFNDNSDFSFRTIHEKFKKIILDDMNEFRNRKENSSIPLIEF